MGIEIERKYLVKSEQWRGTGHHVPMRQGYLSTDPDRVVRVRTAGDRGYLTIKGRARGARRAEFEFEIPLADANEMLALCKGTLVEKQRHTIDVSGFRWEVDEFAGANAGLVVAELEVADEAEFERALAAAPEWLGEDVTDDSCVSNARLSEQPASSWSTEQRARYFLTSSEMVRG